MAKALTMEDVRRIHIQKGWHFFDSTTMRAFSSHIESKVFGNRFFVTSEQDEWGIVDRDGVRVKAWDGKRLYTIREFDPETGTIDTFGEFGEFETQEAAVKKIEEILAEKSVSAAETRQ